MRTQKNILIPIRKILLENYFSSEIFFLRDSPPQFFQVFIAKTFSKLKTNIRNGFPIEFCVDMGVTGCLEHQTTPEPSKSQKTYYFRDPQKKTAIIILEDFTIVLKGDL